MCLLVISVLVAVCATCLFLFPVSYEPGDQIIVPYGDSVHSPLHSSTNARYLIDLSASPSPIGPSEVNFCIEADKHSNKHASIQYGVGFAQTSSYNGDLFCSSGLTKFAYKCATLTRRFLWPCME